jgi:rare lipoprotein A
MVSIGRKRPDCRSRVAALLLLAGSLAACSAPAPRDRPALTTTTPAAVTPDLRPAPTSPPRFAQEGLASWYGKRFHKKKTASGERYDMHELTAAHRTLPLATVVRVTNLSNNRTVVVRINDRGPFRRGRVIDLSASAAEELDMRGDGVVPVRIEVFDADQRPIPATRSALRD